MSGPSRVYVVGFMFDSHLTEVLLIRKERPDWQKGRWNGVGGKVEPGELPHEAMRREFREETGIDHEHWRKFAKLLEADGGCVYFFVAQSEDIDLARSTTDEEVSLWPVTELPNVLPNLRWLIPMATAPKGLKSGKFEVYTIVEDV